MRTSQTIRVGTALGIVIGAATLIFYVSRPQSLLEQSRRDANVSAVAGKVLATMHPQRSVNLSAVQTAGSTPSGSVTFLTSPDAPQRTVALAFPNTVRTLLGITPDQRVLATNLSLSVPAHGSLDIYEAGIYPNEVPLQTYHIRLPDPVEVQNVVLSPQGDRLAWLILQHRQSFLGALLTRINANWGKQYPYTETTGLWVSRIDGSDRREIGFQSNASTPISQVTNLRWTTDGKRLCFLYARIAYSVAGD